MQTFIVSVKDESKAAELMGQLSRMDYVRFSVMRTKKKQSVSSDFTKLYGIWKGRKLSAASLRKSSWKRSYR